MDPNLVIKVKYGDTLRRFSVFVNGNGSLDMGMAGLTEKIRNLFKFASSDDIVLTYIDEDKDVITLAADDDLRDVIRQRLSPLRINVQLKMSGGATFDNRSSGWSTPISSQQVQSNPLSHISTGLPEVLKSLPEPMSDLLSKLSSDLSSKAVSSIPVFTELVELLAKAGLHSVDPASQSPDKESESSVSNKVTEGPEASEILAPSLEKLVNANKSVDPTEASSSKGHDSCNVSRGVGTPKDTEKLELQNTNGYVPSVSDPPSDPSKMTYLNLGVGKVCPGWGTTPLKSVATQKERDVHTNGKSVAAGPSVYSAPSHPLRSFLPYPFPPPLDETLFGSFPFQKAFESGTRKSSASSIGMTGSNSSDSVPPARDWATTVHPPVRRSFSHLYSMGRIFHRGVQCDGCGVHPITGPRFKSKVREDYDLCSICFSEIGNEVEYTRMDSPCSYRRQTLPPPPPLPPHFMPRISRAKKPSLNSCFVLDINIPDGTLIAPSTPFTKIWRMRNNGADPWPLGTQLVCIGGYQFTTTNSVSVQIPGDGCAVGKELDIAVDFIAPGLPGRCISYWQMVSPSGQKFGQRIWVLIEVDTSIRDSLSQSNNSFNLNLPPKFSESQSQIIDMNVEPVDADGPECETSNRKPMVDEEMKDKEELDVPINEGLDCNNSVPLSPVEPPLASYPAIESSAALPPVVADATATGQVDDSNMVEETLLKELEEMGFKQIDLNKEILRHNEYNLEQSVDDLCGVSEWDPILEELQEMGFCDKETNKRLLMKNGGSIKRVVMDLVEGEEA